jgi:hypothetical protein
MMFSQTNQSFAFRLSIAKYVNFDNQCPFSFEMNSNAVIKGEKVVALPFLIKNRKQRFTLLINRPIGI